MQDLTLCSLQLLNLVNLEGDESFDPAALGSCDEVVTEVTKTVGRPWNTK